MQESNTLIIIVINLLRYKTFHFSNIYDKLYSRTRIALISIGWERFGGQSHAATLNAAARSDRVSTNRLSDRRG